ncbi:MAG: exosortase system-associated protein, TIGR04073 family [Verrucomicrobiota bacterium]|nr:exosortase system-associated protein, TIGR04073 family [Verrucomicrobiota bacterium]
MFFNNVTKFFLLATLFVMFSINLSAGDYSVDEETNYTTCRKLGRGCSNILTGIWEVPKSIYAVDKDNGGWAAITTGTFTGIKNFVLREFVGVWEVLTSPLPRKWVTKKPLINPEYQWEPVKSPFSTNF